MTSEPPATQALLDQWRDDLASWAIPREILDQASEPPWAHHVAMFTVGDEVADSVSHRIAREAVPPQGSVLDIGCGGGRASMALVPPAAMLVGVDHQQAMLDAFTDAATARGVRAHTYLGDWPDVADEVPEADVVVCHHVLFNVAQPAAFLRALDAHAKARVVIEIPTRHPLSYLSPLWQRFWGLERPSVPTEADLVAIARAVGFDAQVQVWHDESWGNRSPLTQADRVRMTRLRLCLPPEREDEVAAAMAENPEAPGRPVATIWWDVRR